MKLKQNYKLQSDIIIYKYIHAYILSIHILYVYRFATKQRLPVERSKVDSQSTFQQNFKVELR